MSEKKVIDPEVIDPKYAEEYSETKLFEKLPSCIKVIGKGALIKVFELYYLLKQPNLPWKIKGTILAALGYFILPIDVIPDLLPVLGFTDDIAVLTAALVYCSAYITDEIKEKARAKVRDLLG